MAQTASIPYGVWAPPLSVCVSCVVLHACAGKARIMQGPQHRQQWLYLKELLSMKI